MRKDEKRRLSQFLAAAFEHKEAFPRLLVDEEGTLMTRESDGALHVVHPQDVQAIVRRLRRGAEALHRQLMEEEQRQKQEGADD